VFEPSHVKEMEGIEGLDDVVNDIKAEGEEFKGVNQV
jgi:hypothetical protein